MSEFFAMVIASIVAFVSSILGDAPLPPVIPPAAVPQVEVSVKVQEPVVKQAKTSQPTQQPSKKSGSVQPAPETKPAESTSTPTPEESSVAPALFKDLGGTTRVLANGNAVLARFSITAGNVAASIDGINLVLTRYGGVEASKVRVFAFTDEFRTPVTTHTDASCLVQLKHSVLSQDLFTQAMLHLALRHHSLSQQWRRDTSWCSQKSHALKIIPTT